MVRALLLSHGMGLGHCDTDVLADALRTIELSGFMFLRADLGGPFGLSMPAAAASLPVLKPQPEDHRLVMFHIVREGNGFLQVEGHEPQALREGDLIVVFDDMPHSFVDSPGRKTVATCGLVPEQGERSMRLVCGMLEFVDRGFNPVFSALPTYLHVPRDDGPPTHWLQDNLSHILREAESARPGSATLLSRLTELLFVETLRCYLEKRPDTETGWLAALNDPIVGKALQLIHEAPAHGWTVADLAGRVGASRSAFSARFGYLLGIAPIAYVTRWRIRLATNLLEKPELSMANIAKSIGYESESTFSRAFKREMEIPPATWRNAVASTA